LEEGFSIQKRSKISWRKVLRFTNVPKKVRGRFYDSQLLQKKLEEGFEIPQDC